MPYFNIDNFQMKNGLPVFSKSWFLGQEGNKSATHLDNRVRSFLLLKAPRFSLEMSPLSILKALEFSLSRRY